jgi:hypothetical protein
LASAPGVRAVSTAHLAGDCFWCAQVAASTPCLARIRCGNREQLRCPGAAARHARGGFFLGYCECRFLAWCVSRFIADGK